MTSEYHGRGLCRASRRSVGPTLCGLDFPARRATFPNSSHRHEGGDASLVTETSSEGCRAFCGIHVSNK